MLTAHGRRIRDPLSVGSPDWILVDSLESEARASVPLQLKGPDVLILAGTNAVGDACAVGSKPAGAPQLRIGDRFGRAFAVGPPQRGLAADAPTRQIGE